MAGENATMRRLRGRDVPVLGCIDGSGIREKENNHRGKAKAGTKRSASVQEDYEVNPLAPALQHPKKRAALANLTNSNRGANSVNMQPSKQQVIGPIKAKLTTVTEQQNDVHMSENVPPPLAEIKVVGFVDQSIKSSEPESVTSENSVASVSIGTVISENISSQNSQVLQSCNNQTKTSSSVDTKTHHNLSLLKSLKLSCKQDDMVDDHVEGEGWSCKNHTDIDSSKDPQMCSQYAADIYHHLRMAELKRRPVTDFMENLQQDINTSMRSILVDWLVEVADEYQLVPDTLYLAVSYIDRFLSKNVVTRQRLQLLGVASMLIASKYEEICAPQVEEFCYITDNTYTRQEVLEMERCVLKNLNFELTGPTIKSFLRRFIRAAQAGQKTPTLQLEFLGNYLSELTLVEYDFLGYLPSLVAGSSVFLAALTLDPTSRPWNSTLQHYSGYKPSELKECVLAIHELQKNTKSSTLPAIREKYRQHKFRCVATIEAPDAIPADYFEDLE